MKLSKIKPTKRAQTVLHTFETIPKLIVVGIIMVFIISIIFTYINEKMDTDQLEINLLYNTITNSKSCLASDADSKIIDFQKLENKNALQNSCKIKPNFGITITLTNLDNTPLASAALGQQKFVSLIPVCKTVPSTKCFTKSSYILYTSENKIKPGIIHMEVLENVQ